ncbi:histone deacetylase family protein [Acetobacteraceae bacterium AT-5844]|nr:histone deacetylase family protein [Acetobacteraceae bacterium AT-5844]
MSVLLLTHPSGLAHENGEDHPECPDRLRAVMAALEAEEFACLVRDVAPPATEDQLCLAHPAEYVRWILSIRPQPGHFTPLDGDTAMNHASAEAALHAAGAAVAAVDAVCADDSIRRAFCATRPPGHHAEPRRAMGFCLFGNAVIAARHAQRAHGLGRVAILDFDVHHGNGTQAAVWDDPTILFASSHQSPCYPYTGAEEERGAAGNIFNATLPPGADGTAFRAAWAQRLLPAVEAFAPELLVISAGFDAHARDPLAQLRVREADFGWLTDEICRIADRLCGGRVVSLLEGGYDLEALAASTAAHLRALMG